jgi:formylglycine-generating enzyme required for sulfatase activity
MERYEYVFNSLRYDDANVERVRRVFRESGAPAPLISRHSSGCVHATVLLRSFKDFLTLEASLRDAELRNSEISPTERNMPEVPPLSPTSDAGRERATSPSVKGTQDSATAIPPDTAGDPGNRLGLKFVRIRSGHYTMGSPDTEPDRSDDELLHDVKIIEPFMMSTHLVTRRQFAGFVQDANYKTEAEIKGSSEGWTGQEWTHIRGMSWRNPGFDQEDNHPVVCVSWNDAQMFVKWLRERDAMPYHLPTEAQWEYACRAGSTSPFHVGATLSTDQANYNGTFAYGSAKKGINRRKTTSVGTFPPNAWGLYDMHGNALEWCEDWFGPYPSGDIVDPGGPATGERRVVRGGGWSSIQRSCRSAYRGLGSVPDSHSSYSGFRLCIDAGALPDPANAQTKSWWRFGR